MFYYFNAEKKFYENPAPVIDPILNNNDWATIQYAAQNGIASDYWNVGDRKEITLNGTCRARTFSNYKVYAYILGFNHNATLEGNNTIHFQIGFDALSEGKHIALTDIYYNTSDPGFQMNSTATNVGGWSDSFMRNTIIPAFIECMPSDLQDVLKTVNKYTDNHGNAGGDIESYVTATQDKVFLLAEYEVLGTSNGTNTYEKNSQARYDYYKNSTPLRYRDLDNSQKALWWLRSPMHTNNTKFINISTSGGYQTLSATSSLGFAPAFVVG